MLSLSVNAAHVVLPLDNFGSFSACWRMHASFSLSYLLPWSRTTFMSWSHNPKPKIQFWPSNFLIRTPTSASKPCPSDSPWNSEKTRGYSGDSVSRFRYMAVWNLTPYSREVRDPFVLPHPRCLATGRLARSLQGGPAKVKPLTFCW